jgi:hypothetical protein
MVNSLSARRGAVDLDQIGGAFDVCGSARRRNSQGTLTFCQARFTMRADD